MLCVPGLGAAFSHLFRNLFRSCSDRSVLTPDVAVGCVALLSAVDAMAEDGTEAGVGPRLPSSRRRPAG